jgi:hypothetical protein
VDNVRAGREVGERNARGEAVSAAAALQLRRRTLLLILQDDAAVVGTDGCRDVELVRGRTRRVLVDLGEQRQLVAALEFAGGGWRSRKEIAQRVFRADFPLLSAAATRS